MPLTRNLSALTLTAAALALPASAQASSPVSVRAVVDTSVRAELHLERAHQLADRSGASDRARALRLLARSRRDLRSAASTARILATRADTAAEISDAVRANTKLSSTLSKDAATLSDIAVDAAGRLERAAATALVSDLRMQRALLESTITMAGQAGADNAEALAGAVSQQRDAVEQITAASELAGSSQVSALVQSLAALAVGVGIQTIAAAAQLAQAIAAGVVPVVTGVVPLATGVVLGTATSALKSLVQLLGGAAAQVSALVAATQLGADEVAVSGHGDVTLGLLGNLGIDATASLSGVDSLLSGALSLPNGA